MNKKKDPNKAHYFLNSIFEEFTQALFLLCEQKDNAAITIWEKGENENLAERYTASFFIPDKKIIKMKPIGSFISQIGGSTKTGRIMLIKIQVNNKYHYFTGGFFKFNPEDLTYSLEIKQDIVKSLQRSDFRLTCSSTLVIQFKINNQVFNSLDISVNGTSFMVEQVDLEHFKKGSIFNDCILRFDRKNYHIPSAKVANIIALEENDQTKGKYTIGITFINTSQLIKEELEIKISTEALGEEMRKKFDTILAKKKS